MATMDIKQMLQNGSSPEDLKAALDRQITQAMDEIREEKKAAAAEEVKNIEIKETRENLIDALLDYLTALGLFEDTGIEDEDFDEIAEILKGARWIIDNFYNVEWKHRGDEIDPDVALSKQILYRKGSDYDIMRPKDSVNVMDFVLHGEDWVYLDNEFFKEPEINCDEL